MKLTNNYMALSALTNAIKRGAKTALGTLPIIGPAVKTYEAGRLVQSPAASLNKSLSTIKPEAKPGYGVPTSDRTAVAQILNNKVSDAQLAAARAPKPVVPPPVASTVAPVAPRVGSLPVSQMSA